MKTYPYFLYILSFVALIVCSSCDKAETQQTIEQKNRREAFVEDSLAFKIAVLPTSDCDNIRRAKDEGVFDSLGVTVHLREYNALSECRYALKKGTIQGAAIDSTLARIISETDNVQLTLGPSTSLSWKLIANSRSRVSRTGQLVDKITAADSHGASHDFAVAAIDSIVRSKSHSFVVQVEDIRTRFDMLNLANVDAAMLPEPYASQAVKAGHKVIKDYTNRPKGVIVFRSKDIKDKRIDNQRKLFIEALEHVAKNNAK